MSGSMSPAGGGVAPAAVVGASGFIGSALVRRLKRDRVPVRSFTREVPFVAGAGRIAAEVSTSHTVFWLSASVNPATAEERPDLVEHDQVMFESLLRGLEADGRFPRVVLLSSGGTVYDPAVDAPYTESSPVRGTTAYARAKLALEDALLAAGLPDQHKLVVRAANVYGPGQPARRGHGVISHWLHAARDHRPLVMYGPRETIRDFVFIDDLVDALVKVHLGPAELPRIINLGSGRPTSLGDVAQAIEHAVRHPDLRVDARPARPFDLAATWLDISLADRSIGWRPRTSLGDGVAAAWRWVRSVDDAADRATAAAVIEK